MTAISVAGAGKRYVKYEDTPLLVTRALRLGRRTRRSALWALRGASFEVAEGECIGVIGRNGSGKSTLLRMLAGVTAPTEGSVAVRGRVAPLIAVGVGFHPELTGRENVQVNGTVLGLSRRQIDERFDEIVDFAGIHDFIDTPVKFYSSGMFVRLGFSVAVLAEPDVLLVDEVLAVGDVAFQMRCYERMTEIQASGTTIVVVSHNLNAIRKMCPRSLLLHDGVLRVDGPTPEVISSYHDVLAEVGGGAVVDDGPVVDAVATIQRFELLSSSGERTAHVTSGDEVTFSLQVRFDRAVEQPLVGFTLQNEAGAVVYGDSTPWTGHGSYAAGDVVAFDVRVPLRLAAGSYSALVGVTNAEGVLLTPMPRPLLFYVDGRTRVTGLADLGAEFSVREASDVTGQAGTAPPSSGPPPLP